VQNYLGVRRGVLRTQGKPFQQQSVCCLNLDSAETACTGVMLVATFIRAD
jgi:hypothetical protein